MKLYHLLSENKISNLSITGYINMKLSKWAKLKGISYLTAYRWFKAGKIPNATQHHSGTIMISEEEVKLDKKDEVNITLKKIEVLLGEVIKKVDEKL